MDRDPALVTAIPCQLPALSRAVTKEIDDATSRMLARNVSRIVWLSNISADM